MKQSRKWSLLALTLILALLCTGTVLAQDEEPAPPGEVTTITSPTEEFETNNPAAFAGDGITPYYAQIFTISGSCSCSSGKGNFYGKIIGQSGKVDRTRLELVVQQRSVGSAIWKNYKYYSASSNTEVCTWIKNQLSLDKGYSYRLKVTGYAYKGTNYEADTLYTNPDRA